MFETILLFFVLFFVSLDVFVSFECWEVLMPLDERMLLLRAVPKFCILLYEISNRCRVTDWEVCKTA